MASILDNNAARFRSEVPLMVESALENIEKTAEYLTGKLSFLFKNTVKKEDFQKWVDEVTEKISRLEDLLSSNISGADELKDSFRKHIIAVKILNFSITGIETILRSGNINQDDINKLNEEIEGINNI